MDKKKKSTIKDIEELEKELRGFKNWLPSQINKTLYQKYRIKKPLKFTYRKWILKKIKTVLKTHIGKLPSQLTKKDIEKWEEYCYSKYQNNGNLNRFMAMNKLLTYLGHKDWKLKLPPVERRLYDTLTEEERERYLNTVNKRCEGILDKSYSQLKQREIKHIMDRSIVMIQTTMESRPSEVCDIEIRNIDFERHKIKLRDSKTHEMIIRMGMEDALLLTPAVEEAIKDWLKIRKKIDAKDPEDDKYLFIYPYGKYKGEKINYNKLLKICKEIGVEAKIKTIKTTPYCLKRTEITRDCDRTNNIRIPQLRARHTDFNSTMRYNQKTTNDVVDYLQSEKYDDTYVTPETKLKKLAERAVKGEIPLEVWQQLRADLQLGHPENKKKNDLVGYG
jgi:integrase